MSCGLKNVLAIFQKAVDTMQSGVRRKTAFVYLYDVVAYSETEKEHLTSVPEILQLLQTTRVTLKLKKCTFFDSAVPCVDHAIRLGQLEVVKQSLVATD